ncbi:4'-phosphopantetheinyl transferase superfamily protein [Rhizobiaceae bacterium BDR2-2]|uniref:Enterobactin synthase component D n=1 Tax=Ectorhizobium quercum TaxID=2965071 RepID=A0AAE3SW20_9HYPH|nr:4'-phosphopantetheinyl transferase superfamily protein [Ectorhizobium quercum]MCX8996224.1 4'-phosphopantetheinyl transferase superfamily protein [Ectorhizobium quercum]MCX8998737.1 4'-phosphopantetheinyl transferase superfamily protein [Ectorhizobium quercum]
MEALRALFAEGVGTACCDPRAAVARPYREEERFVERAVDSRRREFHAGRACARMAMSALGLEGVAIPAAPDRAPVWPEGVVGSISHCATLCVAAVALVRDGYGSIGLDVEPAEPLPADLVETICTPEEEAWLGRQPPERRMLLARAIFSAKESLYKCQYPLTGVLLDFQDIDIALHASSYHARFRRDAAGIARGTILEGRLTIEDGYILTGLTMTASRHAGLFRRLETANLTD